MKLSKQARTSANEVIQVNDYELVAALWHLGIPMPRRQHAWVSEEIADDFYDDVMDNSVYIYPRSDYLTKIIEVIKSDGLEISRKKWLHCLDEMKMEYGVGPSTIEEYAAETLPNGRHKIISHD